MEYSESISILSAPSQYQNQMGRADNNVNNVQWAQMTGPSGLGHKPE